MSGFLVKSAQGNYRVEFEPLSEAVIVDAPPAAVIIDARVAALHRKALAPLFSDPPPVPIIEIDATEDAKSWAGIGDVLIRLQALHVPKGARLLAIGGGVVQDIACFVAHVWLRGVRWDFWPTTLLAQADSCIGAKAGVNVGGRKNQVGCFHSPASVTICGEFLDTLPDVQIASGWGEILKLALTDCGSEKAMVQEAAHLSRAAGGKGLRSDLGLRAWESLLVKREIIQEDEHEQGRRILLSYGHTFGHALESVTENRVPHGLAVAWGIDVANFIAWRSGGSEAVFRAAHEFVGRHLRFDHGPVTADALLAAVAHDKKAADGQVRLVLPGAAGLEVLRVGIAGLRDMVTAYLAEWNAWRKEEGVKPQWSDFEGGLHWFTRGPGELNLHVTNAGRWYVHLINALETVDARGAEGELDDAKRRAVAVARFFCPHAPLPEDS